MVEVTGGGGKLVELKKDDIFCLCFFFNFFFLSLFATMSAEPRAKNFPFFFPILRLSISTDIVSGKKRALTRLALVQWFFQIFVLFLSLLGIVFYIFVGHLTIHDFLSMGLGVLFFFVVPLVSFFMQFYSMYWGENSFF